MTNVLEPGVARLVESRPIVRILRENAETTPDAPALTCDGRTVTRGDLEAAASRRGRALEAAGVGLGDFVTIALPNSVEFFETLIACWKVGAVPQPVSHRLPTNERQEIVHLADSKLVVGVDSGDHPGRQCLPEGFVPDPSIDQGPMDERVSPILKAMTSGGSTGRPKLILYGGPAEVPAAMGIALHMTADDRQLVPGPLYHNSPLVFSLAGLLLGQHLVVLPKFDAVAALEAIQEHEITWVNFVPTMMSRMLRVIEADPDAYDLSSIRIMWHMAAPCAGWLKEAWIDLVGAEKVWELYGGTEAQALTVISGAEWLEHRGSVGRPAWGGQTKVLGIDGKEAAVGEVGEIYLRRREGVAATYEYVGAEARERDGWETLGDLGWMDEDGYLYISDRRTDMILAGGANIYPAEVEAVIDSHPKVLSSVVVGLPDADLGQRVHALVQAKPGLDADELLAHAGDLLVHYKVPRSVEFIDQPLRDDAGKVRRSAMRDAAVARMAAD